MKVLQIIDQAFRTTTEEQDDTILWLSQAMARAGAQLRIVLGGDSVFYAVLSQRQPSLKIGNWSQQQPANIPADIQRLIREEVAMYVIREDMVSRGLINLPVHDDIDLISRADLPRLFEEVDQVWKW